MSRQQRITPALPRGMRDHLPEQLRPRLEVVERIRRIFELYGFQPLETPALERLDVLTGKYGEEGEKLTFRVMKRGEEFRRAWEAVKEGAAPDELADLGLRYDLTVPLARVVAQYGDRLPRPFKRYQIAPVWRADRPQHGRYREFIQCDVDIVGTDSRLADAELIVLMADVFNQLGLGEVEIHVNDRKLLFAMSRACGNPPGKFSEFCIELDKLEKVGREGVAQGMNIRGLATVVLPELWTFGDRIVRDLQGSPIGGPPSFDWEWSGLAMRNAELSDEFRKGVRELFDLYQAAIVLGVRQQSVIINPFLARGLDYYTGPVYEAVLPQAGIGSLGGGGRYDELIGLFTGKSVPATGTSFGLERIVDLMLERGLLAEGKAAAEVSVLQLAGGYEAVEFAGVVLKFLRNAGVSCEPSYHVDAKIAKHIQAAAKRGNGFVVFVGDDELARYKSMRAGAPEEIPVTAKRLTDGVQKQLSLSQFVLWLGES